MSGTTSCRCSTSPARDRARTRAPACPSCRTKTRWSGRPSPCNPCSRPPPTPRAPCRCRAHGDHLRQTARLEHGRDEDEIRGGVHQVRQRLVEREAKRRVGPAHAPGERVEVALDPRVRRGAEEDELRASLQRVPDRVLDQVEALLRRQTRDDADERLVRAPGEPEPALDLLARASLPRLVRVRVVVHRKELIGVRVPNLRVDAVPHAVELAVRRRAAHRGVTAHLPRVRRRNRRRDLARGARHTNLSLAVVHVVDREDHVRFPQAVLVVVAPERARDLRGGPVVAVQNVRLATRLEKELERGVAEKVKSLPIVVPAVHRVLREHPVRGLDEKHLDVLDDAPRHGDPAPAPVKVSLVLHVLEHRARAEELVVR
eukprot:31082-Pelagococcus_subviridis.AAC.1